MSSDLLQKERQDRIRALLAEQGRVLASDLVALLHVSEDTIRRDLSDLARAGHCERVHGGALAVNPRQRPIAARRAEVPQAKQALAAVVAGLVSPGMTLFLDTGSTNIAIASALPEGAGLTVITHALDIALALSGRDGFDIRVIGGRLDANSQACFGAEAGDAIARLRPDLAVLGACGLEAGIGITAARADDAEIKRMVVRQARAVLVAATSEKFSTANPFVICPAEGLTDLVVEADLDDSLTRPFTAAGARLHRAAPPAGARIQRIS